MPLHHGEVNAEVSGMLTPVAHHCRVSCLYQHIFPPNAAPTLSFVGLPWKVVPFAQYELQAKWIARVLSKRVSLPSRPQMEAHIDDFYASLEQEGIPKRSVSLCCLLHVFITLNNMSC